MALRRLVAGDDRTETWLGDDDGRSVVVERLRGDFDAKKLIERVRSMGRTPHPGIERALAFSPSPPSWTFASDDAVILEDLVHMAGGSVPAHVALVLVRAIAAGLAALDRDNSARSRLAISPARVRVGSDRSVRLRDPGFLAALDMDGVAREARAFAAPELLAGDTKIDDRAEVFALGALLHQLATEERAWSPDRNAVQVSSSLDAEIRPIVTRALALSAQARPRMTELITMIDLARVESGDVLGAWLNDVAASRVAEPSPRAFDADAWLAGFTAASVAPPVRRPTERVGPQHLVESASFEEEEKTADNTAPPNQPTTYDVPLIPSAPHSKRPMSDATHDDPMLGMVLHGYRLAAPLGNGTFSRVYLGQHVHLDRRAAIKVLRGSMSSSQVARRRMAREANALAELEHPHVVALLDFGMTPSGLPFLITEMIEGKTLARSIKMDGLRSGRSAAKLGAEIARGLAAAHAVGIVHRDLKPANVMLGKDDKAKILDFGVARMDDGPTRLTALADIVGTPSYMAPEQIRGAATASPSADLYSLGVVLHHAVTGKPPFVGSTSEVIDAHLESAPPPLPDLGGLERVIVQLMAKDPADRPPTAVAVAEMLEKLAGISPPIIATAPAAPRAVAIRWGRIESLASLAIALAALIFAVTRR